MHTKISLLAGIFITLVSLWFSGFIFASETLTVAIDREYAPYEYVASNGMVRGFTPALLLEMKKEMDINIEFRALAWPDAMKGLQGGIVDLVSMIHTPARENVYALSKPHSLIEQSIFRHAGNETIHDLETLSGHRVALQENDISLEKLTTRQDFEKVIVHSKIEGFLLLNLGKVDAFLAATHGGIRLIGEYDFDNVQLAKAGIFPRDYVFAARKNRQDLINRLDVELERLRTSGRLQLLRDQWLSAKVGKKNWLTTHAEKLFIFSVGLLVLLVTILTRLLYLQRQTKKELSEKQNRLKEIILATQVGTWEWDILTGETTINDRWAQIVGYSRDEISPLLEKDWKSMVHTHDLLVSRGQVEKIFSRELEYYECELRLLHKSGEWVWVTGRGKAVLWDENDRPLRMSGTLTDITSRKNTELQLQRSADALITILNSMDCLAYITDMETYEILFINKFGVDKFGELIGTTCWQGLQAGQSGPCEFCTNDQLLDPDGKPRDVLVWEFENTINRRWYECRDRAVRWVDGRMVRMELAFDITERKMIEESMLHMASHDGLTGLPNRALLMDRLDQAIERANRDEVKVAVLFLDLDKFKPVNDAMGHMLGDKILREMAERMQSSLRGIDSVARFGGDEFAIIMTDINNIRDVSSMAEKLNGEIVKPIKLGTREVSLAVSIGISIYPDHAKTGEKLLSLADAAMYEAKRDTAKGYHFTN